MTESISVDQPIAEAVRLLMGQQLADLQAQEERYRAGDRKEGVHRMRVAIRRMRALLRLFGERFTGKTTKDLTTSLRSAARVLGQLRDLDVLTGHLLSHQEALPEADREAMDSLIRRKRKRRKRARRALDAYLNGKQYRKLIDQLTRFTTTPGRGVRSVAEPYTPQQVRHVLGSTLWGLYEHVWAFGPLVDDASTDTLHQLRIECKYLRYALEFFTPVLEEERVSHLTTQVIALQDHLGALQDAMVASEMLATEPDNPGSDEYLATRRAEAETQLATFPDKWATIDNPSFRRDLATLIANL